MIKLMKCKVCGSLNCTIQVGAPYETYYIDSDGFEDDTNFNIINDDKLLKSINNDECTIYGSCVECDDLASLIIEFEDDKVFEANEKGALKKLIQELKEQS
jgi:hypothetical protein